MIKVTRRIQVSLTEGFSHAWDIPNSCVSLESSTVLEGGIIQSVFQFQNEECMTKYSPLKLRVVTDSGCSVEEDISFDYNSQEICGSLQFVSPTGIQCRSSTDFFAPVVGGTGELSYLWNFDSTCYDRLDSSPSILKLALKDGANEPEIHQGSVTVTDFLGCSAQALFAFNQCSPIAQDERVNALCLPGGSFETGPIRLCVDECPGTPELTNTLNQAGGGKLEGVNSGGSYLIDPRLLESTGASTLSSEVEGPIDWSTFEVIDGPVGGELTQIRPGLVSAKFQEGTPQGVYIFTWRVTDRGGIVSNIATVYVMVPRCDVQPQDNVVIFPITQKIKCEWGPGEKITFDLRDQIKVLDPDTELDWESFSFIPSKGTVLQNRCTLQTCHGIVSVDCNHELCYVLLDNTEPFSENIQFQIRDRSGERCYVSQGDFVFSSSCKQCPGRLDIPLCVNCGETVTVALNDVIVGNIDLSTFQTSDDSLISNGDWSITNGVFTYTAPVDQIGSDQIPAMVLDFDGNIAWEGVIRIVYDCLNDVEISPDPITVCNDPERGVPTAILMADYIEDIPEDINWYLKDFTGEDELVTEVCINHGCGLAKVNEGDIVGSQTDIELDFTGSAPGRYTFTMFRGVGNCQVSRDVIIDVVEVPFSGKDSTVAFCNNDKIGTPTDVKKGGDCEKDC